MVITECAVVDCGRSRTGRSRYCGTHVSRLRRHGDPDANFSRRRGTCSIEGCEKPHMSYGFCKMHATRFERHGDPTIKIGRKGEGRLTCSVPGCAGLNKGNGLCAKHLSRLMKWGALDGKTSQCQHCGKEFKTTTARLFCSQECHDKSYWTPDRQLRRRSYWQRYNARKSGLGSEVVDYPAVFERDAWVCQLCGGAIDRELRHPHRMSASVDHVVPLSRGGLHAWANVQAAHYSCNSRKNNRSFHDTSSQTKHMPGGAINSLELLKSGGRWASL